MSELVTKVQEMLKEETWTRATISNYTSLIYTSDAADE